MQIKKRAVGSENFLGELVCTGSLESRLQQSTIVWSWTTQGILYLERHGCIIIDLKRNLDQVKPFRIAPEALIAVFVCSILMNTILMNIL